jgi:ubiquinone biosynthesis accessory factor UbiJ
MFEPLVAPVINRLLRANSWTVEKLRPHAHKTVLFTGAPFELRLTVLETGEVAAALRDAQPDVTINMSPAAVLRATAGHESAWRNAQISGDTEFAGAIDYIRGNIRWDFEEDLSRIVGDVAAHRLVEGVRELDRWGRDAVLNLGRAFAEYATYERPLIASARAIEEFNVEVDEMRDAVERLEKRLELLIRKASAR